MLFVPIKFKTTVQLYPAEMDIKYQERMIDKIKEEYEGVCSKYGYIRPNSIEIIKRSCAVCQKAYFNGAFRFEVLCRAEVCNPVQGSIVEAIVKNKNQLGILAESFIDMNQQKVPILDIIIPIRSAGIISQVNLEQLQIGENIHVEVMGKKYQMKDHKISIIGRVVIKAIEFIEEVVTEEEEDVEHVPGLDEELYDEIPVVEEEIKKDGGAEDETKIVDDDDDEDGLSSIDSEDNEEDPNYEEEFDEIGSEGGFVGGDDD